MTVEKKTKQAAPKEEVVKAVVEAATVKVYAKIPPLIDLINDIRITAEPVEVEMHPWLQLQLDAGLLIKV